MNGRDTRFAAAMAIVCAALALLAASTSSPLYATNFWTDTNIYFTIGRGMTQGLMPYRDLFDHKGPLLYMLYALGAMMSDTGFAGVFVLEVIGLAATLFAGYRIVRLYGENRLSPAVIPLLAVVTATCTAFTLGGSAEEFCLPALAAALYAVLARMRAREGCVHPLRLNAAFGAAMGWVFLIKYTDCGLFFGLGLFALLWEARVCGIRRAVCASLAMLGGMMALVVPVALYLLANGVLGACVNVYFVQNLFTYSGEPMTLAGHIYNALAYLRTQSAANPVVAALAALGCIFTAGSALLRGGRGRILEALAVPAGAGLLLLFAYWGEMAHPYYALVFAALCAPGLCLLAVMRGKAQERAAAMLCGALMLAVFPMSRMLCVAAPLAQVRRADMPQEAFAEIINREEEPTLLDLTSLDQGFYLAAGITPNCRYFADNNLQTQEKKEAIAGYIERGDAQFIVTRYRDVGDGYALVAEASGVFDVGDMRAYKLYRRIDG